MDYTLWRGDAHAHFLGALNLSTVLLTLGISFQELFASYLYGPFI